MITIPSVLNHKNVVVYPDDEDCNLFYALKTSPDIRLVDGQPVFSGLFWTDQANGSGTSVAGLAGGWINFDSHLGVTQELLDEIAGKLKSAGVQDARRRAQIKAEKERIGLLSKARGEERVPDPDIPPVREIRFGAVNFTEGTVELLEEKGGELVPWSSAGGPASLLGDNNAAFALRLSPTGAAIWYKTLKEGYKAISIRYDLKFMLRLPSLEIRAWAGSTQESEINRKVERVWRNTDQGCSDADVERVNVKEIVQSLREEGLMNIEIKKGSTEISDEHVSQLRDMAMKLIEAKVQEIIKSRIQGMTPEERQNSMIELIKEEVRSFVELRFTQQDVVEWQIAPQGTIMNFLEKVPDNKKQQITKLVDLSVAEVSTTEIDILADAPWDEAPFVTSVVVKLEYPAAKESHSVMFKKGDPKTTWRFRTPKNDDGKAVYTTEVYFRGVSKPLIKGPETTNSKSINVSVGKDGLIDVKLVPHTVLSLLSGDNEIKAIQCDLSYRNPGEEGHFADTAVLQLDKPEGVTLSNFVGHKPTDPLHIKTTYFTKGGTRMEMPEKKYYLTENKQVTIYAESPFHDTLDIPMELTQVPDESVKKIQVEFKYTDEANKFSSTDRTSFSKEDNWEAPSARILLINKDLNSFQYRYKIISNDAISSSDWINAQGEETIFIPLHKISLNAGLLKLGTDYVNGNLTLQWNKDDGSTEKREIFLDATTAAKPINWYVARKDMSDIRYQYHLMLLKADGTTTETSADGNGAMLILKTPA